MIMMILLWFYVVVCSFLMAHHAIVADKPISYAQGDTVELKVNKLYSSKTLIPIDYYRLPFCRPEGGPKLDKENFGEYLAGDRIESSPYLLKMKTDMYCEQVCASFLGSSGRRGVKPNRMAKAIREGYHNNWIVDNLPAGSKVEDDRMVTSRYWHGFPVGFVNESDQKAYVHNHVNMEIMYHKNDMEPDKYRVVRFMVEPFSIRHEFTYQTEQIPDNEEFFLPRKYKIKNPIDSCDTNAAKQHHTNYNMIVGFAQNAQEASGDVLFTYDVIWTENPDVPWADRWHIYLSMDDAIPAKVHWLPIGNSVFMVMALSALVVVILVRNVRNNIDEEILDETNAFEIQQSLNDKGYELVHVDYFHPPDNRIFLLAIVCGTGAQILTSFIGTTVAVVLGLLRLSEQGHFVMFAILAFDFCGIVNGFFTVQIMKLFKETSDWTTGGLVASIFFPGITFALFLGQQCIAMAYHSTLAVPISVILILLALWLGILVPSTYLGAYIGNCVNSANIPTTPRTVLLGTLSYQSIRKGDQFTTCLCGTFVLLFNFGWLVIGLLWLVRYCLKKNHLWRSDMNGVGAILVGGVVCFASVFIEMYYILSTVWMKYYYETFGFLLLVALILFWTCGVVSVLFNYVNLTVEASHSWWWQFLCSGATGFWLAFYSVLYSAALELESFPSVLLYYGFMAWVSFAVFLTTGFVGFGCSFLFIHTIFSIGRAGQTMLEQGQQKDIEISNGSTPTKTLAPLSDNAPPVAVNSELM